MIRRVAAFALALVIAGVAGAVSTCAMLCADIEPHSFHDATRALPPSCHDTQPTDGGPSINSNAHACAHGEWLPAAPAKLTPQSAPVQALIPGALLLRVHTAGRPVRSHVATASPPDRFKLSSQLRI